jgi:predicted glutamine amidotransferase
MCIIILHKEGIVLNKESFKIAFNKNDDGFGLSYVDKTTGQLKIYKSIGMKDDNAYLIYKNKLENMKKDSHILIHMRIGTGKSKIDLDNCHPFAINNETIFAHNGIIPKHAGDASGKSDTYMFNEVILKNLSNISKNFIENATIRLMLEDYIGFANKLAFLTKNNFYILNEKLWIQEDGIYYSNNSYKNFQPIQPINSNNKYYTYRQNQNTTVYTLRKPTNNYVHPSNNNRLNDFCTSCGRQLHELEEKRLKICWHCMSEFDYGMQ